MARLPKKELIRRFELAIQDAGARLIYRSATSTQPVSYTIIYRDGRSSRVLVYIRNVTPGGNNRPTWEYRIQPTKLTHFETRPDESTLILGWSEDFEVFAGWDYRRHSGPLGKSSSFQISDGALRSAQTRGFAPYVKGTGETAIAFRADLAAAYVEHLIALHDTGGVPAEAAILEKISEDPAAVPDAEIDAAVAPARRVEIVETRRAARDAQFRRKVLRAYENRCAVCGVQLRLLDAAHVLPVDQPGSTDDTNNGVALCALHHRAYDRALIAFDPTYTILVNRKQVDELTSLSLAGGLRQFQAALKPSLILPADPRDYPRQEFIAAANKARGW
jgi:putative restriction endonuclease